MEHERDLEEYRACLLKALTVSAHRSACSASDPIHVFVNERRAGLLDGAGAETSLQLQSHVRIDTIQLRSEDGVLLGGLSAPEFGFRTSRIALLRDTIELRVHNTAQGGSVSAIFMPAPSLWRRTWRTLAGVADAADRRPVRGMLPGVQTVALTQALLAIVVVGLAASQMTGWMTQERARSPVTPAEIPWAAPLTNVVKLEQQLGELAQMQAKAVDTIQTQQQGMAQLQGAITKLSSTQEAVASSVLTVRREMEKRQKGQGHDVERVTRLLMTKAQTEQEQLEAEIHSLIVANDKLSKDMAELEQHNQDLKKRLKSAGQEVSKAIVSDRDKPMVARQEDGAHSQPFLFWVAFGEGTSQKSIDQWVRKVRGQKRAVSGGWQEVEIVSPTIPPDRFLEQIRQTKIVKAVRIS